MPNTLPYTGRVVLAHCWCGVHHGVPEDLYDYAKRTGASVYCPLGHKWVFSRSVRDDLLLAENRLKATRDLLTHEEHSHRATRGHLTRVKKRVAAGVCPCCNRSFKDLARHMAGQHPNYVLEAK